MKHLSASGGNSHQVGRWPPWALSLGVVAVGLLITSFAFQSAQSESNQAVRTYFDFRVREAISHIELRVATYEQVLISSAALFKSSKLVERKEFKKYIESLHLEDKFPGIQGVGFSLIVPSAQKERHIAEVRREGFAEYSIRPEGERDPYTSIIYLEPFSDLNLRAFGYDMYSEPVRHAAMQNSLESGRPSLSGKVRLVQESGQNEQAGFLMYIPVYRNDRPHTTLTERRENVIGWVYSVFRMNDFMAGWQGERATDLDIEVYDGEIVSADSLMYGSAGSIMQHQSAPPEYLATRRLMITDHLWTMTVRPSMLLASRVKTAKPRLVAIIGTILSALFGGWSWLLLTGRVRAINTAKAMSKELIQERSNLTRIIDGTGAGTWEWNVETGDCVFNEQWANIIGYELKELGPISIETWKRFAHPDDLKVSGERLEKHFSGQQDNYECESRLRHKDGRWVWVLDRGKVATWTPDGKPLMMFGTHQDITERKQMEEQVRQLAFYDTLTKLPNRRLLNDRLGQAMSANKRNGLYGALIFLDLDNFKPLNDTHGHVVGDLLLIEVANRLKACVRGMDTVARFGGDEFVVLLCELDANKNKATSQAKFVAEKILAALSDPYLLTLSHDGQADTVVEHRCTTSIGVAFFINHEGSQDDIMGWADAAMYRAKEGGRNQIRFYES
jgi:diguanylate cyclase (GGDEF)-like protein/PAS domain S-box-containing protein